MEIDVKANALKEVSRTDSFTLPDGTYYVGCPSFVIPFDEWELFLLNYGESGIHEKDGHKFITIKTGGDGYFDLYDTNEDGTQEDENGNAVEGPVHADTVLTDVALLSIIPVELLGGELEPLQEHGATFGVESGNEDDEDNVFEVDFQYKIYEGDNYETLSQVEFLWYQLKIHAMYMEMEG